jgi:hypothetical protein
LGIAQDYSRVDSRIKLFHGDEFLPPYESHNRAVGQISKFSKYCKILHADDLLFSRCITEMVELAEAYPGVGIISSYRLRGERIDLDGIPYSINIMSGRDVCRRSLMEGNFYVFGTPTSLLMRSDLIRKRNPVYRSLNHCDLDICYDILKSSDFGFVHQVLTYTRLHKESITTKNEEYGFNYFVNLWVVNEYGDNYLSEDEFNLSYKKRLKDFYRYMGLGLLQYRGRDFWKKQVEFLGMVGLTLNKMRVLYSALSIVYTNLTRPSQYKKIFR